MKMTFVAVIAALLAGTTGFAAEGTELFNGKDLTGWVQRGGKAKYTVEDGCVVGRTVLKEGNSFLCPEKNYCNFILELDFKVDPELNSGVQIRSECLEQEKTVEHNG